MYAYCDHCKTSRRVCDRCKKTLGSSSFQLPPPWGSLDTRQEVHLCELCYWFAVKNVWLLIGNNVDPIVAKIATLTDDENE